MGHWQQPLLGDFESVVVQSGLSEGLLLILFRIGEVGDERPSELQLFGSRLFLSQPVAFTNARASTILDKVREIPRSLDQAS
jgi:hypothetical protein